MVAKTYSAILLGLSAVPIIIEIDGRRGVPGLHIIGLPNRAVSEAKERITAALQNVGIRIKSLKTLINLAPADLRKDTPHLELAMAVGLVSMYGLVKRDLSRTLLLGTLSLDGQLKAVKGCVALVKAVHSAGFDTIVVPSANQHELCYLQLPAIYHAADLHSVIAWAQGHRQLSTVSTAPLTLQPPALTKSTFDQVTGQSLGKRALVVAAAGHHHVLFTGTPGIGKTLLAQALPDLLPPLSPTQLIEIVALQSLTNTSITTPVCRPFRQPHHTASLRSLIGGGNSPGEISLAHQGVLFLDELAEFPRTHLEALRQPLESRQITFISSGRTLCFPSDFQLIAATNPCPCGYAGSGIQVCHCSLSAQQRYRQKLSGPFLDRIDLCVRLEESSEASESDVTLSEAQAQIKAAHTFHQQASTGICSLTSDASQLLKAATHTYALSHRSRQKVLSVARTIADLVAQTDIDAEHVAEALQYRPQILNEG